MIQWVVAFSGWLVAGVLASKLYHATRDRDDVAVRLMRCTIELEELHQKMSYFDEMITKIGNALFGQKAGATPEGGSE